jgi:hypothetical protein
MATSPSDHYTKNAPAAPRIFDTSCKATFATLSAKRRNYDGGQRVSALAPKSGHLPLCRSIAIPAGRPVSRPTNANSAIGNSVFDATAWCDENAAAPGSQIAPSVERGTALPHDRRRSWIACQPNRVPGHSFTWHSPLIRRRVPSWLGCMPWCKSGQSGSSGGCRQYWPPTWLATHGSCTAAKSLRMPN